MRFWVYFEELYSVKNEAGESITIHQPIPQRIIHDREKPLCVYANEVDNLKATLDAMMVYDVSSLVPQWCPVIHQLLTWEYAVNWAIIQCGSLNKPTSKSWTVIDISYNSTTNSSSVGYQAACAHGYCKIN